MVLLLAGLSKGCGAQHKSANCSDYTDGAINIMIVSLDIAARLKRHVEGSPHDRQSTMTKGIVAAHPSRVLVRLATVG